MKLNFLNLSEQRRRRAIEEAATRRMTLAVILEKDFWVCWMLSVIFESPFTNDVVFKGGTSLSRVFGVIDRFSEDIDLSLSPEFLKLPVAGASRNQANKWMERAEAACSDAVRDELRPVLEAVIRDVLGGARNSEWLEFGSLIHEPTFKQIAGDAVFNKARVIVTLGNRMIMITQKRRLATISSTCC